MILEWQTQQFRVKSYTRTRGDDPARNLDLRDYCLLYPHTRGWSQLRGSLGKSAKVIPAHAGMILQNILLIVHLFRYTRTRGDDPGVYESNDKLEALYPHTRGWSYCCNLFRWRIPVIPAHAGMILTSVFNSIKSVSYTRTRGDDPAWPRLIPASLTLYPHTRGWSYTLFFTLSILFVIPAHAGMIL